MNERIGVEPLTGGHFRWACAAAMTLVLLVGLACPAMGQARGSTTRYCGTAKGGFFLEAGSKTHPTSCGFARATFRAYRKKWGLGHAGGHSHFQLAVAGRSLSCSRGVYEAEVGESVFEVRCHDSARFVDMSSEKGL